ncbi:MAG TPA: 50S ribosomal protein L11 methyltransferase [Chitinophagaceae bacterium]|nr:50S ribosomal protein L11 methyltransferase [Chitinophagaceae bacterium]
MHHIKISIEASEVDQEILIGLLNEFGATGFEQTETQLFVYFEEGFDETGVHGVLKKLAFVSTNVLEQNWNAVWEAHFQPVIVGRFCAVRAHFHQPISMAEHEIVITPKMSFGTGHHATTYMMLSQMQALNFQKKTVLDFGTGTGVLAILAEKRGAAQITAIDNDTWSFENVQENILLNNCSRIEAKLTETIPAAMFDIVLANITKNVLLHYMGLLKSCLNQNGSLLVSGLLAADEAELTIAAQNWGFHLVQQTQKDGWVALLFAN